MPSGEECTEIRLSVPEAGRRLLPLPVVAWHTEVGKERLRDLHQGDEVLVYGRLIRRFYRSGAGARSLTEVVASGLKHLESSEHADPDDVGADHQPPPAPAIRREPAVEAEDKCGMDVASAARSSSGRALKGSAAQPVCPRAQS